MSPEDPVSLDEDIAGGESIRKDYPLSTNTSIPPSSPSTSHTSLSEPNQITTDHFAWLAVPTWEDPGLIHGWPYAPLIDDAEWPADQKVQTHIPDAGASVSISQVMLFDFPKLSKDLQTYLLRFVLHAPGGIINPWLQNEQEIHEGPEQSKKYLWGKYFRPTILATNRDIYYEGMGILYEQNTFIFTRRVFDGSENRTAKIAEFFSYPHQVCLALGTGQNVHRSKLIKNVCLQDSDMDNDVYAANGYAKPLPEKPRHRALAWQFKLLRQMEWLGFDLHKLTLTFDQDAPGIVDHLRYETGMRQVSGIPGGFHTTFKLEEVEERGLSWGEYQQDVGANEPFPYTHEDRIWCLDGLHTRKLYVRGMAADAPGIRALFPSGRTRVTNAFAHELKRWLDATGIFPYGISFTGQFQSRRIKKLDGTFIEDDLWYPINVPLPPGNDKELLEPHEIPLPFDMNEGLGFYSFI